MSANKESKTFKSGFDLYAVDGGPVGCGGSGTVFKVRASDGNTFAVKVLDKSKATRQKLKRFQNEIQFCQRPGSDHIVRVVDYGLTEDGSLFYVMPYYRSTLRDQMQKRIHQDKAIPLFSQVLDSVEAAHLLGVCHRDVKPENLLYDPDANKLVLADFGIAHFQEDELVATKVITGPHERLANFAYASPEQHIPGKKVDYRADIYALGLILNEIFTGHIPYGTSYQQIKESAPDLAYLDGLVDLMLRQEPSQRPPSVTAVKEDLIGRGNDFVRLQTLEAAKRQVAPESDINDSLISDPIRAVETKDYKDGALVLRFNQPINKLWERCFRKRATSFSANVSSAHIVFQGDRVSIHVTEHFLPQGVAFFKQYCGDANEEYAKSVREEHQQQIALRRNALKVEIREREAKEKLLKGIQL
jgi:serine/threonine protein kinase